MSPSDELDARVRLAIASLSPFVDPAMEEAVWYAAVAIVARETGRLFTEAFLLEQGSEVPPKYREPWGGVRPFWFDAR